VSTLHITNGDSAAGTLRTFLRDPVITMVDVLHEGPAPMTQTLAEWRHSRAEYLSSDGYTSFEEALRDLTNTDEQIAAALKQHDEIVFWFEHDLFDQLLLVRALDLLVRLKADPTTEADPTKGIGADSPPEAAGNTHPVGSGFSRTIVSLICIDRFPGVERFCGLGQLNAAQLATLTDTRTPVTPDQYALATHAWAAFCAADPRDFAELARLSTGSGRARDALPFLGAALTRFLAEYPSVAHGLSRTEELALAPLREGPQTVWTLFLATQAQEARPFMGDWSFYTVLRRLASARTPLLSIRDLTSAVDLRPLTVTITDAGRDVIEGRQDAVAVNGIDRWLGGVHLIGEERSPWRWDAWRETLVS